MKRMLPCRSSNYTVRTVSKLGSKREVTIMTLRIHVPILWVFTEWLDTNTPLFLVILFIFNWRITALKCVTFLCTTMWIRYASNMLNHFGCVQLVLTPWPVANQAPLSMGFSRKEYWSAVPCPPPGDLSNSGVEPASLTSPTLACRGFLPLAPNGNQL